MIYFAPWKIVTIVLICVLSLLYAAPNLLSRGDAEALPRWAPRDQVTLGLDLQGGSQLLLEVDTAAVVRERLNGVVDSARGALRTEQINYTGLGVENDKVVFSLVRAADAEKTRALFRRLEPELDIAVDGPRFTIGFTEARLIETRRQTVDQSIEIVRRRVDETGTREPTIQRQGDQRILVQLPGLNDPERIKSLLGKTAKMSFRLVDPTTTAEDVRGGRVPVGSELLPSDGEVEANGQPRNYVVRKRVMVSGDSLTDAQATFQEGQPVVSFRFDSAGGRRFGEATKENVGRPFAIVLDNKVISAPVIREPILGGAGIISGRFTVQTAQDLALLLRAGALPAPLTILEERTVGPGLGADSIRAGMIACAIAMVLVLVFMIAVYGLFGVFAILALSINLVMIFTCMSLLGSTLTLPGIAGIVLTMGMSVDANVLIFERIREEQRAGRSPISALDAGFQRAFTTIIDANLTTLIAAALLFQFGSGPVKGFAVTLSFGIITSMFTAIMLTRLMVVVWLKSMKPRRIPL
ncbi:MAG: protein translocase subunit SecD [Alphaproteobacteria bacterium]|nr:protein translocase subunit SecD [Alphaproteobacteria bacterium]